MGAWSNKPFGNDTALDWLADLERQCNAHLLIEQALEKITAEEDVDAPEAEEAIAAVAVVSAACVEPVGAIYKDAKTWITSTGFVPDKNLLALSKSAIATV